MKLKEKLKDVDIDGFKWLMIILIIFIIFLALNAIQYGLTFENKTIEGQVIHTDYVIDKNYLIVEFSDGNTYNLQFSDYHNTYNDLTDNSKLIINIHKASWWLSPNTNDIWIVDSIIKVPEEI